MDKYAIYTYCFKDAPVEGDLTLGNIVTRPDSSNNHRRAMLDQLFGRQNTTFIIKKYNKSDADDFPCTVLAHFNRFVLLRIERPKTEKIFEKHESQQGEAARINERLLPSFPYIYVIIDCREGCGNKVAISIDSSVWRSTDKVAELVQANVNRLLDSLSRGFRIILEPELMQLDFVSHSRNLVKKKRLSVDKMTIYFTRGMINPKVEEIIKEDPFIKRWMRSMYSAPHGQLTLFEPNSQEIFANKARTLEHIVALVASDPVSEPFRLKMTYSDGSTYSCGKDIRMEFRMDETAFMSLFGQGSLFPEHEMGAWFDSVTKQIEEQRNAENSKQNRTSAAAEPLYRRDHG